jgi:DNA polymerase-3 subunit delta'
MNEEQLGGDVLPGLGRRGSSVVSIIGHHWAVDLLSRQLAQGQVAHAYLFTGPPQVGRGTLARWFAQALLCQVEEGAPCGVCGSCRKVAAGNHPDLRMLNLGVQPGGRRTLGIEGVREMRAGMAERPFAGRRKVYLIEDAETMTVEAANAFLKTLEEPPPFVVLLLVALSDHMLLPTIVSRCQLVPLRTLSRPEVRQALVERWGVEEERAGLLAALSHGRPGWAIQAVQDPALLQQREDDLGALVRLMGAGLLDRFAFAEAQERDWKRGGHVAVLGLLEHWQGWWRDVLLLEKGCDDLVVNQDARDALRVAARQLSPQAVSCFMQALRSAQQYLQEQVNPRLVFEDLLLQLPAVVV